MLPRERMYWENSEDVGVDLVRKSPSRNQFCEIKRNIHLTDNNQRWTWIMFLASASAPHPKKFQK